MNTAGALFFTAAASVGAFFGIRGDHKGPPTDRRDDRTHASSTADVKGSIDLACLAAAVAARETSLDVAMGTETAAINTAYTDRASALASAYSSSTSTASVRSSVRSAWKNFTAGIQLAHRNWKSTQQGAWATFKTAVRACGAGAAALSDSSNASVDASAGGASD